MAKSVVSIAKGTDIQQTVREALDLLGGVHSLVKPGEVVVLKPNAGHPLPPETSVCTNPDFVAAVIKEVRKAQPKEIIVAEAAAGNCDTLECFEVSGIRKAAEEAGVDRIIDIKRYEELISIPIRDSKSGFSRARIARFLVEADHLWNLPVFKPHVAMVLTNALKNWKGVTQGREQHEMHQTADHRAAIIDLWSVVRADLSIADLIRPAEGYGPHHTFPFDYGCVVASKDPVALDATCCRMLGLDVGLVPYFELARDRGIGVFNENQIEIRGRTINEVFRQCWYPYLEGFENWPEYNIYDEGSCSCCQGIVAFTLEKLKSLNEYEKNAGVSIVLGPYEELPEGVKPGRDLILIGTCVKKFSEQGVYVNGCPPNEGHPLRAIIERASYQPTNLDDYDRRRRGELPFTRNQQAMVDNVKPFLDYLKLTRGT